MRRPATAMTLLLALSWTAGCQPSDRRPGVVLRGEAAQSLPADWSFSDAHPEIGIQVSTPYGIPHAVTIWCAAVDGALFLGARNPDSKRWVGWAEDESGVRLKIGGKLYDVRLERVEDEALLAAVRGAYREKYALPAPGPDAPPIRYWVVRPLAEA